MITGNESYVSYSSDIKTTPDCSERERTRILTIYGFAEQLNFCSISHIY